MPALVGLGTEAKDDLGALPAASPMAVRWASETLGPLGSSSGNLAAWAIGAVLQSADVSGKEFASSPPVAKAWGREPGLAWWDRATSAFSDEEAADLVLSDSPGTGLDDALLDQLAIGQRHQAPRNYY